MQYRTMGRNGPRVSVLGFGCGAIGGLLTKGDQSEQRRTVARAPFVLTAVPMTRSPSKRSSRIDTALGARSVTVNCPSHNTWKLSPTEVG